MAMFTRKLALVASFLTVSLPFGATGARAQPGTAVENVELKTLAGGKEKLLSPKARANVIVFFRPNQDRSLDALKQMAICDKEFAGAGKPVRFVGVVSSTEPAADVQAAVAAAGATFPILLDEGDKLYDRLDIRLHPMVGIVDAKFKVASIEQYRQISYCDIIRMRIKLLLGEATQQDVAALENPEKSLMPGDDPMKKAMRDVNMAKQLIRIGQLDKALGYANKALELAPVAPAFAVMGEIWAKKGDCAKALKSWEQALKLDPNDADAKQGMLVCAGKT
jgi:tetratricopeptide (TPR) repeat protein